MIIDRLTRWCFLFEAGKEKRRSCYIVDPTLLANLLNILLFVVFLSIALRAFFLYAHLRSPRLFILGLSMAIIACTAAVDFASGVVTSVALNTDWFLFVGQAVGFAFIFLSLLRSSEVFLRRLMLLQIVCITLVFFLLFLAPTLPAFPNMATQVLLSGSRSAICFLIFGFYVTAFTSKKTRFSLLMSAAFLLLSIGYCLVLPKYFLAHEELLDQLGDGVRILGLGVLLIAYLGG
jgi:hypothetical protein